MNCTTLVLDLNPPHPEPLPVLVLNNMEEVIMSVSMATMNISLSNVTSVQYIGHDDQDSDQVSLSFVRNMINIFLFQMYFFLSIGLGALCGVLIIVLILCGVLARYVWSSHSSPDLLGGGATSIRGNVI